MSLLIWKMIHIASVIAFLGNITTGLFWAAHAHKTRDRRLIASTFDGIIRSDRWFTIPGVVGILVSGVAMALHAKLPILSTGWLFWAIVLFSLSGVVFGVWLVPLQRKILQWTGENSAATANFSGYEAMYKRWEIWGLVALATPITAAVLMVIKPALPGLR